MIFIFKQENRAKWSNIINSLQKTISSGVGDYEIELRTLKSKRSGSQLKAYWMLIESVKNWMNEQGNTYSRETVSDWFKIQSGHSDKIAGLLIAKSIANKSSCTRLEMEAIINTILIFGAENGISDCEIQPADLRNLLEYYKLN